MFTLLVSYVKAVSGGPSKIVGYRRGLMSAIAVPLIPDENWSQYAAMLPLVVIGIREDNENNVLRAKTFRKVSWIGLS